MLLMPVARIALFLVAGLASLTVSAEGGAFFASDLVYREGAETHRLAKTGETERVVLVFRVYDLAHYAAGVPGAPALSPATVVKSDGRAKAIAITFARKLGMKRIRSELSSSIRRNAEPGWLEEADDSLQRFLGSIDRDAQAGDRLVYYWLPGGRLRAEYNGEGFFSATDESFAKLIWSIWFGDEPACDRDGLLAQVTASVEAP